MTGAHAEASSARRVGRYVLGDCIGTGGMADVFIGSVVGVRGFRKPVAIKRLNTGRAHHPASVERLVEEAKLLSGLQHGNIVDVVDLVLEDNDVFVVMQYVDGPSLRQLIGVLRPDRLPIGLVTYVIHAAAVGLAFAHGRPNGAVIHADVSPSNLLLTRTGEVRVADFGIARREGVRSGKIEGKFSYMAPEQAIGDRLTPRADVYALGVVLHELLSGERPKPSSVGNMFLIDGIPGELLRLCARCLADAPGHRPSMHEVADALSELRYANGWREGASELADLIRTLPLPERRLPQSVTASLPARRATEPADADATRPDLALAESAARQPAPVSSIAETLPDTRPPVAQSAVMVAPPPPVIASRRMSRPLTQPPPPVTVSSSLTQPPAPVTVLDPPPVESSRPLTEPPPPVESSRPLTEPPAVTMARPLTEPPPVAASIAIGPRRNSVATPIAVPPGRSASRWGFAVAVAMLAVAGGVGTAWLDRGVDALEIEDSTVVTTRSGPIVVEPVVDESPVATSAMPSPSPASTAAAAVAPIADETSELATGTARTITTTKRPRARPSIAAPTEPRKPARVEPMKSEPAKSEPKIEPAKPTAGSLVARGTELALLGKLQPAREAFQAAIAADANNATAHRGLGVVYQRSGYTAAAIAAYRRYLELRPGAPDAAAIQDRIAQLGGAR